MPRGRPKPITWKQLEREIRNACSDAGLDGPIEVVPWTAAEERDARARDHAYVYPSTLEFHFSAKTLALPSENRKAIVAHEVGHCLAQHHWGSSTEDEADAAAQQWLGTRICYDHAWPGKGLQTTCARARARNPSAFELPPDEFLEGSVYREPLYHGSGLRFEQGHTLRPDLGNEYGIYLTPRRRYARAYGDHVAEVYVSLRRPLVVEGKHEISARDLSARDVSDLSRRGYDGIIVTSSTPEQASEVVVFRPDQAWVARVDNPSRKCSRNPSITPGTPPRDLSDYMKASEIHEKYRSHYFEGDTKIASSRTTPAPSELPIGTWKYDDELKGAYGHEIDELVEIDPRQLEPREFDWANVREDLRRSGKLDDAERYAEWLAEGNVMPPVPVVETEVGTLRLIDGHRRTAAADMAGVPVRAWISWLAPHPKGLVDSNGRPMKVGLTYEIATGRATNPSRGGNTRQARLARRIG